MPLSQRSATEPQDLARLDRRTVLQLCAASLSAAALGTGLSSCASGPDKHGKVVFKEVHQSPAQNGRWRHCQDTAGLSRAGDLE